MWAPVKVRAQADRSASPKTIKQVLAPHKPSCEPGVFGEWVAEFPTPLGSLLKLHVGGELVYRFKHGKFAGRTMEQAMLRNAPTLYQMARWAKKQLSLQPHLRALLTEFERLRALLNYARSTERCREKGCKKRARWMTFEEAVGGGHRTRPEFWCNKHGPDPDLEISEKVPIHFDSMHLFKTKRDRTAVCKNIKHALGIARGKNVTKAFALEFFINLSARSTRG